MNTIEIRHATHTIEVRRQGNGVRVVCACGWEIMIPWSAAVAELTAAVQVHYDAIAGLTDQRPPEGWENGNES